MKRFLLLVLAVGLGCVGCDTYKWSSGIPAEKRTVSVPVFRNGSEVTEFGAVATREVLREFQREGTFRIASHDDAAVEVQGEVVSADCDGGGFGGRKTNMRLSSRGFSAQVKVSVIDRKSGKVLIDGRCYDVQTQFVSGEDLLTAKRDASGRLAEELARRIVDDVLGCQW